MSGTIYKLAAFTDDPSGGNPAGVWVGDELPSSESMQRIAKEVGFSETAFVVPINNTSNENRRVVRYYSPEAEVPFCGHATIATGALLGRLNGEGIYKLETMAGEVPVSVIKRDDKTEASLTSVQPMQKAVSDDCLNEALASLGWRHDELDTSIPPINAYAGAWHLVLATSDHQRLTDLNYDFERLKALMLKEDLTTLQLIWRESDDLFHARNPFPVGGVVEDPATGAAAAALGGYLRDAGLFHSPGEFVIKQGETMGRPSFLRVEIPEVGGIKVTGVAVDI